MQTIDEKVLEEISERLLSIERVLMIMRDDFDAYISSQRGVNGNLERKLDSIIEVFGGLEKMMDQLRSEGMSGLLKMMRGK